MNPEIRRHASLPELVRREAGYLQAVRTRLLAGQKEAVITERWLSGQLEQPEGIDRLESFYAKFSRMQDTVVDKLIPALLRTAGEPVAAAIDNLGRMERLGLITSADDWLQMRGLRNWLVHEYFDRPMDLALALERACRFTEHALRLQTDHGLRHDPTRHR